MKKIISVIVATYNGELFIKDQLESILNQVVSVDEIIVIDDCSHDNTLNIISEYCANNNITVYHNERNLGVVKSINKGLSLSSGDYVFLADQDDIWHKDKVKIQLEQMYFMEKQHTEDIPLLSVHDASVVASKNRIISDSLWKYSGYHPRYSSLASTFIWNTFTGCCILMNRALVNSILPIPVIPIYHDQWIGLVAHNYGYVGTVDQSLMSFVRHGANSTEVFMKKTLYGRLKDFISHTFYNDPMKNLFLTIELFESRYKYRDYQQSKLVSKLYNLKKFPVLLRKIGLGYLKYRHSNVFNSSGE